MTITNDTVNFIKGWEKFHPVPYADYKQYSVGYGTYAGPYPGPVPNIRLTEAQAHDRLMADLKKREQSIKPRLKVKLNNNQYGALMSFAFNLGVGHAYTIIDLLNQGKNAEATTQMLKYVNAGGKRLQGLVNRRNAEVELFNKPAPKLAPGIINNNQAKKAIIVVLIIITTIYFLNFY